MCSTNCTHGHRHVHARSGRRQLKRSHTHAAGCIDIVKYRHYFVCEREGRNQRSVDRKTLFHELVSCACTSRAMSDQARPELHLDEKWDKVINSMFSRSAMGGLAGAVAGFLLFSVFLF